jgi:predicted PurR-regulated permease PerM
MPRQKKSTHQANRTTNESKIRNNNRVSLVMPARLSKPHQAIGESPQATVLFIGGILLLLLLVYNVIPIISPFVVLGAILFLLYPLRRYPLSRTVMWLAVLLFTVWFLYSVGFILFPFIMAFLVAYVVNPLINIFERRGIRRWLSSLVTILVILGIMASIFIFIMPIAFQQFQGIIEGISGIVNDVILIVQQGSLFNTLTKYGFPVERLQELLTAQLTPRLENILKGLLEGAFAVISSLSSLVSQLINIVIIPFLAFYMMKDFPAIINRFKMLVPKMRREIVAEYFYKVDALFGRYLRGVILVAFIHGILASLLLSLFGIRYPLVLGMVAGVLSPIPYFGLLTSLFLSLLVALFSGEPVIVKVLFVLITYGVLQILEFSVLSPNILGKQIGLHPVLMILSLLIFGFFLGFIGLLIAIPTTAIVIMSVKEWEYRRKAVQQLVL